MVGSEDSGSGLGILSGSETPSTHSCVRRSGSIRTKRSNASIPSANSRLASDRFAVLRQYGNISQLARLDATFSASANSAKAHVVRVRNYCLLSCYRLLWIMVFKTGHGCHWN